MGGFRVGVSLPDAVHIIHAGVDLAVGVVWQHGVYHPLVECQLAPVIGDFEHVVDVRLDLPCPYFLGSFGKPRHHFRLDFARLGLDVVVVYFRYGEL